ncbi:FAD-linked oxidoreductase [Myriangium duriaei CBS 260.36]|uniref:Proline dehydrogenase n=1 Tax=Myriangium duriaei CBS 260.36 TaxID=1168546 RepID=A0A9P4J1J7_9PEZI|nr:FAD-linked oxidoreductase [Myriangium duriaei CBS 260.36]
MVQEQRPTSQQGSDCALLAFSGPIELRTMKPTTLETKAYWRLCLSESFVQAGCEYLQRTHQDYGTDLSFLSAFAFCSTPLWVDMSESLYNTVSKTPVLSSIAHIFVMNTFFEQFLGGETTEECAPKIENLWRNRIGTLLGYNIEANLDGSSKDPELIAQQTQMVLESIESQGLLSQRLSPETSAMGRDSRCWVRIKVTGLLPHPIALEHASAAILAARKAQDLDANVPYPGLPHDEDWKAALTGAEVTASDREQLLTLRATLETIMSKARDHHVRVVIDAEQSWYQPVIDSLTDELMQKYNTNGGPATCIASFQAYLRRYPQMLDYQIQRAQEKGYQLLLKQVRGAYMITEDKRWREKKMEGPGPVWSTKAETDASYDYGVAKAIETIAQQIRKRGRSDVSVVFATHNSHSVDKGLRLFEEWGLAVCCKDKDRDQLVVRKETAGCVAFAQIYGLRDDLTNRIAGSAATEDGFPLVVKSMSYGELAECMPFLARRATENKAVLEGRGGATAERRRLGREIRRRLIRWACFDMKV